MNISKSTLKRHCLRCVPHADDRRHPAVDGTFDAVAYARRELRANSPVTPHPDGEDFFGIRLTDSVTGSRFVDAYNEAVETINGLTERRRRLNRRFRKHWASRPDQHQDE